MPARRASQGVMTLFVDFRSGLAEPTGSHQSGLLPLHLPAFPSALRPLTFPKPDSLPIKLSGNARSGFNAPLPALNKPGTAFGRAKCVQPELFGIAPLGSADLVEAGRYRVRARPYPVSAGHHLVSAERFFIWASRYLICGPRYVVRAGPYIV